jgi:outer membrane protein TolC
MTPRLARSLLLLAVIGGCLPAAAQDALRASARAEADLGTFVRDALEHNLSMRAERTTPGIAEAEAMAARAAFEPTLRLAPGVAIGSQKVNTAAGSVTSTTSQAWFGGGLSGALPYSSLSVAGTLPTGTTYDLSFDSMRRGERPAQIQQHPVEVDTQLTASFAHQLLRGSGASMARAEIRSADLGARAATARLGRLGELTVAAVERAYWALAHAEANERVERDSLQRATTLASRNAELVRLGLVAEVDLLTARQAVAARDATVTQATTDRRDAAERLIFLVYGRDAVDRLPAAETLTVSASVVAPALPSVDDAEAAALASRLDLGAARDDAAEGDLRVEVARSDLRPGLQATASYTAVARNASGVRIWGANRIGDLAVTGWQGGLVATVPLGNSVGKAGYQQAVLERSTRRVAVEAVEQAIRLEVRRAMRAITEGARRLQQTDEALALARRQYEAETRRLELGLSDSFRLLQFEQVVGDAHRAVIDAQHALAVAISDYQLAVGGSTARYGVAGVRAGGR